jgi:hypothetical protein
MSISSTCVDKKTGIALCGSETLVLPQVPFVPAELMMLNRLRAGPAKIEDYHLASLSGGD